MKPPFTEQKFTRAQTGGFTLLELMITLVILGVLVAFALPSFTTNIDTAEEGVVRANMNTIEIFQEDFFLRNGFYAEPLADIAAMQAAIGWDPRVEDGITYAIANSDGTFYQLTATHPDGWTVCVRFPEKEPCA